MSDCIFCKIVSGEIPSYRVYEDEKVLAFLDIAPVHPGHILVIPKKHFKNIEEAPEDVLGDIIKVVKKLGIALKNGMSYEGYNVAENNDPVSGQIVPHLHFHIIPRKEDDGLELWPQQKYKEGEPQEVVSKIKRFI